MATHIIHTPAAMFRGWMVMQLKRPEMAQAWKQETRGTSEQGRGAEPSAGGAAAWGEIPRTCAHPSAWTSLRCYRRQARPTQRLHIPGEDRVSLDLRAGSLAGLGEAAPHPLPVLLRGACAPNPSCSKSHLKTCLG